MPTIDEIIDKHTYTFSVTECAVQDVDKLRAAIESAIREARAAERERCARCIEPQNDPSDWTPYAEDCARLARQIRALKD